MKILLGYYMLLEAMENSVNSNVQIQKKNLGGIEVCLQSGNNSPKHIRV